MPIKAMCPECQTAYHALETAAGRKVKCRTCKFVFAIPGTKKTAGPTGRDPWDDAETSDDLPLLAPSKREKRPAGLPPKVVKPKKSPRFDSDEDDDEPPAKRRRRSSPDDTDSRLMLLAIALGVAALAGVSYFAVQLRQGGKAIVEALKDDADPALVDVEDPAEIPLLKAARPFADAIAAGNHEAAFAELSPLALANAYRDQFVPAPEEVQRRTSVSPLTLESFRELMAESAKVLGTPKKRDHMYVDSRDAEALAGRGDAIERMFTLGGTPDGVTASLRRAALRATIAVKHPDVPEEDAEDGEGPYLNLRIILTEEDGKLRVGYFELMPPSILD